MPGIWPKTASSIFTMNKAHFHLPGLFEFFDFYKIFLPLYRIHRDWFYSWGHIASIYGSPADCIWAGGRIERSVISGSRGLEEVRDFLSSFGISSRLTFSNSLLTKEHLADKKCNSVCEIFEKGGGMKNGVILHSDLLLEYLKSAYPDFYFVSSTTKVLTNFEDFRNEVKREDFSYVVPDFRLNKDFKNLNSLSQNQKDKVEFLCNECCWTGCRERKNCYESVSREVLGLESATPHVCKAPGGKEGYRFSKAMKNPPFISISDIQETYLPAGFSNFKIEGRSLGSALLLEFLLYYLTKPEFHIHLREELYLDNSLDLF